MLQILEFKLNLAIVMLPMDFYGNSRPAVWLIWSLQILTYMFTFN
jgi:hypothetical protein